MFSSKEVVVAGRVRSELSEDTTEKCRNAWMVKMKDASVSNCTIFVQVEDIPLNKN